MKLYRVLVLMFIVLLAKPALAEESEPHGLPSVIVTAEKEEELNRVTTAKDVVIPQEAIKNSTAKTLDQLLLEQGIPVIGGATPYSDATTTIRGYSTGLHDSEANAHLLFFINGRRTGVTNARQLAIGNIERVEIIRGPQMLKYAASSPGGIVNIITKKGGEKPIGGQLSYGYGSYDNLKTAGHLNGDYKNFDYYIGYMHNTIKSDYKDGRGDKVHNSSTGEIQNYNISLGYTLLDNHRFGFENYYYDVDRAKKPQYYDEVEQIMKDASKKYRSTRLMAFTYDGNSEDEDWNWFASYSQSRDWYLSVTDQSDGYYMGQKVKTQQLRVGADYIGEYFDTSFGGDFIKYKTYNSGTPKPQFGYPEGAPMHLGHSTSNYGAYLINTVKLFDSTLNLTGGIRYDYAKVKDRCIGDEPFMDKGKRKGNWYNDFLEKGSRPERRSFAHWSPAFGISYLPVDWLKLRASYTRNFRAPSGRQLFSSDATEGYGAPRDPRLKPEKTDMYEVGFDINYDYFTFSSTFFRSKIKNHITIRGIQDPDAGKGPSAQNADYRRIDGIELSTSFDIAKAMDWDGYSLRPYFNLTHITQRKEKMMDGFDGGRNNSEAGRWMPIGGIPISTMNYGVYFEDYDWKLSANLNFNYFGRTYGGQSPGPIKRTNYKQYGDFTIANFNLRKEIVDFGEDRNLTIHGAVNNIFDERYAYGLDAPDRTQYMPGRNFYIGMSLTSKHFFTNNSGYLRGVRF